MLNHRRRMCVKQNLSKIFCRRSQPPQELDTNLPPPPVLPNICTTPPLPDFASTHYCFHDTEKSSPRSTIGSPVRAHPLPLSSHPTCAKTPAYQCCMITGIDVDVKEQTSVIDYAVRDVSDGLPSNENDSPTLGSKQDQSPPKIFAPIFEDETENEFSNEDNALKLIRGIEREGPSVNQAGFENEIELMEYLKQQTQLLLESFCILNTQFPGHPISATSADILPGEDTPEEDYTYLGEDLGDESWQVRKIELESEESYQLLLKVDLFQHKVGKATHRLITQCDITEFLRRPCSSDLAGISQENCQRNEDVWLFIALEAMRKSGTGREQELLEHTLDMHDESTPDQLSDVKLHNAIDSIRPLYEHCFTIVSSSNYHDYRITHVSHELINHFSSQHSSLRHMLPKSANKIIKRLMRGRRFFAEVEEEGQEARRLICCNPMFGPNLKCWLCFFILGSPSCPQKLH